MSGLGTPQSPNFSGGLMGILSGLLSGYQGEKKEQYQEKETKQEDVLKQQQGAQQIQMNQLAMKQTNQQLTQNDVTAQSAAKASAGSDLQSLTQQLIKDPSRAKDPAFITKYNQLSNASGQIPELAKDGSIDVNRLKPSISELTSDPKKMTEFAQLPTAAQTQILNNYSGVPKSMYNMAPMVTAKDQAALDRAQGQSGHWAKEDQYKSRLSDARAKYYDEEGQLIPARATEFYAGAALDRSRSSAIVTTASATMMKAQAYAQNVDNLQKRFTASPNGSFGAVKSLLSTSTTQLRGLQSSFDSAQRNLENARVNVTDPDQLAEAEQAVKDASSALDTARQADSTLRSSVSDNPQVSAFLGSASGMPSVNLGSSGKQKPLYSTSGGKPVISTDGGKSWNFIK